MLDLSLDQLSRHVGISKRMLIHYFGSREAIEHRAMLRLEDNLRAHFAPESLPAGSSAETAVMALWRRATDPASKGVLLLTMDVSRRAWNGSAAARRFYREQQRLWAALLGRFVSDKAVVEEILQVLQGAAVTYLITGDAQPGKRSLKRVLTTWTARVGQEHRKRHTR